MPPLSLFAFGRQTRAPLANALVFCGDQDAVRADEDGRYELLRQLPGDVEIAAQWQPDSKRRTPIRYGRTRIVLEPNGSRDDVDMLIGKEERRAVLLTALPKR